MRALGLPLLLVRRLAVVVLLALVVLRPGFGTTTASTERAGLSVVLVVDRTKSMDALDVDGGPRFDLVRADLLGLVESLPDAQFAVVSFATDAELALPLTSDHAAVERTLRDLELEDPVDAAGSRLDRPLPQVRTLLTRLRTTTVDQLTAVVLASDGENTDPDDQVPYDEVSALVDDGVVLGYGSVDGGLMTKRPDGDRAGGYLPDPRTGTDARSRLDEANLTRAAQELGVPYVHRDGGAGDPGIAAVAAGIAATQEAAGNRVVTDRELTWLFALGLVALTLLELRGGWRACWAAARDRRQR